MDPMQRQNQAHGQQPQQHQAQHHDVQNQPLGGGGAYGFSNQSQNNDFQSMFNNDLSSSFNPPWDVDSIIDPRIQSNGFAHGSTSWQHNSLQSANELQTPSYGLQSTNYSQDFAGNPNAFDYSAFNNGQQHSFTSPAFDPQLSFGSASLMNGSGFEQHRPQQYERRPSIQEQTISPSALQSYEYPPLPAQDETQSSELRTGGQLAYRGSSLSAGSARSQYSGQSVSRSRKIPIGIPQGNLVVKDPSALSKATGSAKFTGFIFLGATTEEDGEPKVLLPKVPVRKSTKEIKQQILTDQGNNPWHPAERPLLKRLKLTTSKSTSGSSATQTIDLDSSASASEADSDDDLDDDSADDEEDDSEPSPLPAERPIDPRKAIEYDVIKCVWSKKRLNLPGVVIRTALGEYWKIVKGIRDAWKVEIVAMQAAEEKKDEPQAAQRKARAAEQGQLLADVLSLTLVHGHRDIVERLGENPNLFLVFYQFIADRIKDSDYDAPLIANMFQLMTRCTTVDTALLEKTKLDRVFPKLLKRSNEKIKGLAQKVLDNAAALSKQKAKGNTGTGVVTASKTATSSSAIGNGPAPLPVNGVKRPRESLPPAVPATKKPTLAASSSKPSPASTAKNAVATSKGAQPAKTESKATAPTSSSSNPSAKIKINHVVPKPSSLFSSLKSASKKPGTSIAAQKAAQQTQQTDSKKSSDGKVTTPSAPAAPAPKPSFSFAETMANLTKPKEVPPTAKVADSGPPETEEEKKKRVRKEERRKLRVSFKPDDTLTEIRLFVHDPDEDLGHDDSMIRDVGDVGGEGRMLKMHKELETDDDEDGIAGEETLVPWFLPSAVDFSVVEADELARNCKTRGGNVEVKSLERAVQEQRELTTLMAFYSLLSDIPSSPREPMNPYSGEPSTERPFGDPTQETKIREAQFYAMQNPQSSRAQYQQVPPVPATPDISALLQILNAQQPAPQAPQPPQASQPQYQPPQPSQPTGLEAIFAQFAGNKPVPQAPVSQQPTAIDQSLQAAIAMFSQQNQQQQNQNQNQMNYVPPAPAQTAAPDLRALLAQFSQPANQQQNFGYQNQNQNQSQYQGENERKRHYEYDDQRRDDQYSDGKRARGNGKKFFGVPRVPCKFWQEGKCKKGDDCTFLHD